MPDHARLEARRGHQISGWPGRQHKRQSAQSPPERLRLQRRKLVDRVRLFFSSRMAKDLCPSEVFLGKTLGQLVVPWFGFWNMHQGPMP